MKQCPNCKAFTEDEAKFCIHCGSHFAPQVNPQPSFSQSQAPQGVQGSYVQQPQAPNNLNAQSQNAGSYSAPVQNVNQGSYNQQPQMPNSFNAQPQYQAPMAPQVPQKKGIKAWQIVLIVIGGLIGLLVVIGIIGAIADSGDDYYYDSGYDYYDSDYDYDYDYDDEYYDADYDSDIVSYTKGSVVDGWYVNEWANLKFEITDDWYEGNKSEYDDSYTEGGLVLHNINNSNTLAIMFVDLGLHGITVDAKDYLNTVVEGVEKEYLDNGFTCSYTDSYNYTIAGETYQAIDLTLGDDYAVQKLCAKEQDGYIVFINMTADNSFDANATINNIREVN